MMCSPQYKCHPVLLYAIKQQCSSSAMRSRRGSAESLVSPVPLKPKSSEERPDCLSAVAEQCMGSMFPGDRKSTRLNSSHTVISYAVFCLKKKKKNKKSTIQEKRAMMQTAEM